MDPEITKLLAGGGVLGGALAVLYAFSKEIVVTGAAYKRKCADEERERQRAEMAERRLIETGPQVLEALRQIGRVPEVTRKAAEVFKAVGGKQDG